MSSPVRQNLSNLALVMDQLSLQKAPENESIQSKGYVTTDGQGMFAVDFGQRAKKRKNLNIEDLIGRVENILAEAKVHGVFISTSSNAAQTADELGKVLNGLEKLKYRLQAKSRSQSFITRWILSLFGIKDKTEQVIEQINKTVHIVKTYQNQLKIAVLERDIPKYEKNIKELEKEIKGLYQDSEKKHLESDKTKKQKELNQKAETLEKSKNEKIEKAKSHAKELEGLDKEAEELKQLPQAVENLKRAVELAQIEKEEKGKVEGAHKKVFIGKASEARNAYTQATAKWEDLKKQLLAKEKESKDLESILGKLKGKRAVLVQNFESNKSKLDEKIKKQTLEKEKLEQDIYQIEQNLALKQVQIHSKENDLKEIKNQLEIKKSLFQQLETEYAELNSLPAHTEQRDSNIDGLEILPVLALKDKEESSLFSLSAHPSPMERNLMLDIQSSLGLTSSKSKYEEYQRTLIFGFSVGQKHAISDIVKMDNSFTIKDLESLLEGGRSITNMYYLAHYLNGYIEQVKVSEAEMTPGYLNSLKDLQSTLEKSLPFAFKLTLIERKYMNSNSVKLRDQEIEQLEQSIQAELAQMKTGEKLFVPVGTQEHGTLLVLEKEKEDKIKVSLFNTGEGVEENITQGVSLKAVTDLIQAGFKGKAPIKKEFLSDNSTKLKAALIGIFSNRLNKGSMVDINKSLIDNLGNGKSGKPKRIQINGVCSFQVLTAAIKDKMDPVHYYQFKHDLLQHIQKDFKELNQSLKSKKLNNEKHLMMLKLQDQLLIDNQAEIEKTHTKLKAVTKNS